MSALTSYLQWLRTSAWTSHLFGTIYLVCEGKQHHVQVRRNDLGHTITHSSAATKGAPAASPSIDVPIIPPPASDSHVAAPESTTDGNLQNLLQSVMPGVPMSLGPADNRPSRPPPPNVSTVNPTHQAAPAILSVQTSSTMPHSIGGPVSRHLPQTQLPKARPQDICQDHAPASASPDQRHCNTVATPSI
ncbi:hypothetical protein PR048_009904 [Dryococelus australis]|uniref:Uncharacterized protein n=1 Tax=Dryococelus australis TaxID=614101 RepID=A0ABQ9I186_9NEOP|nr:hypothetical protein PR048_009904 [Dryococelus australis]